MIPNLSLPVWASLPPLPDWDALHPLIVHFPIALLLVAPLFVLLAALAGFKGKGLAIAAFLLMLMGTVGASVAVETGEAAAGLVDRTEQIAPVLGQHAHLAVLTRNTFIVVTGVYFFIALIALFQKPKSQRGALLFLNVLFLIAYAGASLLVVNTGHLGGQLVHRYGVTAMFGDEATPGAAPTATESTGPSAPTVAVPAGSASTGSEAVPASSASTDSEPEAESGGE